MSNKSCKDCRHFVQNDYSGCCTLLCDTTCDDNSACICFAEPTVFDQITESPEVLAPNFVYHVTSFLDGLDKPKKIWHSTLIHNKDFESELEAKRATKEHKEVHVLVHEEW